MSIDPKILEQRLVTKDSVLVVSSLTRVSSKLASLRTINDRGSLENFLREIILYKLENEKSWRVHEEYQKHLHEFQILQRDILENTSGTSAEIESLKTQLVQETRIREHRVKCEETAREVNSLKSRSALKRKIAEVDDSRKESTLRMVLTNNEITTRKVQFDSLLTALLDLESQICQNMEKEEDQDDDFADDQRREEDPTFLSELPVSPENEEGEELKVGEEEEEEMQT